jgi:hypothetical protein
VARHSQVFSDVATDSYLRRLDDDIGPRKLVELVARRLYAPRDAMLMLSALAIPKP